MNPKRISVKSQAGSYSIVCGTGVLRRAGKEIAALGNFSSVHVVSSPKVWRALGRTLQAGLKAAKQHVHLMNDAESAKKVLRLIDALDEQDDVQQVHANFDIPDAILETVEA